jgi:hypothetical protein
LVGIPEDEWLNLSEGWLSHFKARCSLKMFTCHGEVALASAQVVEAERQHIQELIKIHGYKLRNIFNMDKIGLFYRHVPFLIIIGKAKKCCVFQNKMGEQLGFYYQNKQWVFNFISKRMQDPSPTGQLLWPHCPR